MTKKRLTGQTLAIIILTIILILTILFGGVFAFYSNKSSMVSGKILLANLSIDLHDGSNKSELGLSGTNIVPNQTIENTPLVVTNKSNANIYLMVVYKVELFDHDNDENPALDENNQPKVDSFEKPIIDLGYDYYNPSYEDGYKILSSGTSDWVDYVLTIYADDMISKQYRCLIYTEKIYCDSPIQDFTVIPKDTFKLSKEVGNYYKNVSLYFKFQAYAVGAESFDFNGLTKFEKCREIANAIYGTDHMLLGY